MITRHLLPFSLLFALLPTTPGCTQSDVPVPAENPSIETRVQTGHAAPVAWWRFSPDGRYLLTRTAPTRDNAWILWDTQTGTQLRTRRCWNCDMSPDGEFLLIRRRTEDGSCELVLESTVTGEVVRTLLPRIEPNVYLSTAFSRDGRYLLALGGGNNHYVWDTATWNPVYEPGMPLPYGKEELQQLREKAESFEPKISRERVNELSTLLFLTRVRPDGKPLLVRDAPLTRDYTGVCFSPDGSRMVGREWYDTEENTDETVIWDVGEAVPLHSLRITNRRPSKLLFIRDGERIICGTTSRTLRLIDGRTFKVIRKFEGHEEDITKTAVSPDEKRILTGDKSGAVILWGVDSGRKEVIHERRKRYNRGSAVTSLAFSPNGDRFLVGHGVRRSNGYRANVEDRRHIEVYETDTGKRQLVVRGDEIGRFNHDGSKIVTETAIRDAASGKRTLVLGTHFPHKIEMSPGGGWAFCCPGLTFSQQRDSWAQSLPATVWNAKTATQVHSFDGIEEYRCVRGNRRRKMKMLCTSTSKNPVYDPNRRYAQGEPWGQLAWKTREAITENKDLDAEGKEWLSGFVESENPDKLRDADFRTMAVSPTGRMLATRNRRRGACPVELRTSDGEVLRSLESDNWTPTAATFSQDEAQLLVACFDDNRDFWLTLWDTKTGKEIRTVAAPKPEYKWVVSRLTLSPDKRYAAVCIQTGYRIHLVNIENGESFCMKSEGGDNYSDRLAFFSPNGKRVFCFGDHRTLWDIETKKQLADFGAYNDAYAPIFSPDGAVLLVQNNEHGKAIWNTETGELIHSFARAEIIFSRDGTHLVAIRHDRHPHELWDFQSGKKICDLASGSPAAGWSRDAFFSPDGNRLVTTYDNELTTWAAQSGKRLTSFVDDTLAFDFRRNQQSPFFLPDGRRFVTVHAKGAVVWDLETGKPIHRFPTPVESKTEAILAPGGEKLLVVTRGREATLWDLKSGEAVRKFSPLPPDTEKVWFNDDGTRLFSRHQAGQAVFMWDVASGEIETEYYLLGDADKWLTVYPRTGTAVGATQYLHEISRNEEQ